MQELWTFLTDTYRFYKANFFALSGIVLPFLVPFDILAALVGATSTDKVDLTALALIPEVLLFPFYQAGLILYIASLLSGDRLEISHYLKMGVRFWPPLFVLSIITTVVITVGLLLLVIPGLIVGARVAFSPLYCIFAGMKPMDAFNSSWEQTKEQQWVILGGLLIVYIVCAIPVWVAEELMLLLGVWNPLTIVISGLIEALLFAPPTVFLFRVFMKNKEILDKQVPGDA